MRLFLKVALIGTGLVLILVSILALVAATQADKLARYGAKNALGFIFQSEVNVEAAELSLLAQTLKLKGIKVGNPKGFDAGCAIEFREIAITFDGASVFSEAPVITQVLATGGRMNLQFSPKEGTNLGILLNQAKRASLAPPSERPLTARRSFIVKKLRCESTRINFSTTVVATPDMGVDVAPFTLEDISKDRPVTASQLSAVVIKSILTEAATFKGILRPAGEYLRDELNRLLE